jgi:type II secretory pathway predicted ATPase ExeA
VDKFATLNPFGRAPAASSALLTYEPYYGLREKPFSLSTDPKFLYRSAAHAGTFEDLLLAIRRREGLIVLTGDIGTGKTTLCKAVLERLDRKTFTTFVPDPFVSREDLLKMLLLDFGVMSIDDLKTGRMTGTSHPDLSYPLYDFLRSLVPLQAFAVLIIDEAQNLSPALLEEIRILSDLESPEKLLQVVLIGQLELRVKLKLPEMRQLDQRVSARCTLEPLNREGVAGYIAHRLSVAGGADDRVHFSPNAIDAVFRASGGVPRVINLLCDRALHRGHLQRKSAIDLEAVTQAIEDLGVGTLTAAPAFLTAAHAAPAAAASAAPPAPASASPPVMWSAAPATTPAAPPAVPAAPPIAPGIAVTPPAASVTLPAAAIAPRGPVPLVNEAVSNDLSGLEVHGLDEAHEAAPMFSTPVYHGHSIFGTHNRPRRRWRWRVLRWAAAISVMFAIVFFGLLGEALFINYFPTMDEQILPVTATPAPPRLPATIVPVPIPADVTLPPPLPTDRPVPADAVTPAPQ